LLVVEVVPPDELLDPPVAEVPPVSVIKAEEPAILTSFGEMLSDPQPTNIRARSNFFIRPTKY
jgi:hypothetical protein